MKSKLLLLATVLLISSHAYPTNIAQADWITDSLSADPDIDDRLVEKAFGIGPDNTYHFVFPRWDHDEVNENGGLILYYTYKECNEPWSEPEIIHPLGESMVEPTMVVTDDNRIIVCYQRYMPEEYWSDAIYVAEKTVDGWVREQIPTPTPYQNWMPQMTSDVSGNLHIAWVSAVPGDNEDNYKKLERDQEESHSELKIAYSTNLSGEWQTQLITKIELGNFGLGAAPQIEVTPDGTAHMVLRGIETGSDPGFPEYKIIYATNLVPGGTIWETKVLNTERYYEEAAHMVIRDDKIHVAVGGSNGWEEPNFTYYFVCKDNKWSEPLRVNRIDYGYPTRINVDTNGDVYITYISQGGQFTTGKLILWKKTGDHTEEEVILVDQYLSSNDYIFDLHKNTLIPYLTWQFSISSYLLVNHEEVYQSPEDNLRIWQNSAIIGGDEYLHLITERSEPKSGIELLYNSRHIDQNSWDSEHAISLPANRPLIEGTSAITASHEWESEILISYLSIQENDEGKINEDHFLVIGEKDNEEWIFNDVPLDLGNILPIGNFIGFDSWGNTHIAVLATDLQDRKTETIIHYGVKEDDEWQFYMLSPDGNPTYMTMEVEDNGAVQFIYKYKNNGYHEIRSLRNHGLNDNNWDTFHIETQRIIDHFSTSIVPPYLFIAIQSRESEDSESAVEVITVIDGNEILLPVIASPQGSSSWNLHNIYGTWGNVVVSFSESTDANIASTLHVSYMTSDFASFVPYDIGQNEVFESLTLIDPKGKLNIIVEQGIATAKDIGVYTVESKVDIDVNSMLILLRSGECMDQTNVGPVNLLAGLTVYPNPANERITISFNDNTENEVIVEIIDLAGNLKKHYNSNGRELSGQGLSVDLSGWSKGLYIIKATSSGGSAYEKFLIR